VSFDQANEPSLQPCPSGLEAAPGGRGSGLRVHHVAIATADVGRLRAFYAGTLGLPVVDELEEQGIVFLDAGGTVVEIVEQAAAPDGIRDGRGWHHLAWRVDDLARAVAELSARGVDFHVPPEEFPPDDPRVRIAFFRDPDGNVLELVEPLRAAGSPVRRRPRGSPARRPGGPESWSPVGRAG
jgi:catechol 2,3-dioxygenase-like lactoylglutathione lyase family enzyme